MEQGPVLIVRFTAQQIIYITDAKGTIVEGDKVSKILNKLFNYLFYSFLVIVTAFLKRIK